MERPNRWFIVAVGVVLATAAAGFAYFGYLESEPCVMVANPGCGAPDPLSLVASWMNSNTSVTLELYHGGQHNISLLSYYIKDGAGALYSAPLWTGQTIPANTDMNITFTIDGKSFAFQPRNTYAVTVRTSQNYLMTFEAST